MFLAVKYLNSNSMFENITLLRSSTNLPRYPNLDEFAKPKLTSVGVIVRLSFQVINREIG